MKTLLAVPLLLVLAILASRSVGAASQDGAAGEAPRSDSERLTQLLAHPHAPLVFGLLTTLFYWWLAGEVTPYARVHDEASYLLQAQTFAHFRWTNPSPPIPAFFEQFHVFVEPAFFSKYPPGHGIMMVPGIWLGLPMLMPMLLHGVAGALLFTIARRLGNVWIALLAWLLWLGAAANLAFRPMYFSEATSGAMWMGGWYALLRWRESRERKWLLLLAACTGWMAITRPLTAAAYAIPIAVVAGWDIVRHRLWRDAGLAFVLGCAIVAIMPLWSWRSLGQARPTPYSVYSEVYFPFDKPGFGIDSTPAQRPLPYDMQRFTQFMSPDHAKHQAEALPSILATRAHVVAWESLRPAPMALGVLAVVGLAVSGAAGVFALVSAIAVLVAYLAFGHDPKWTVYYVEIEVVLPFLVAMGAWAVVTAARKRMLWPGREALRALPAGAALAGLVLTAPVALAWLYQAPSMRAQHWMNQDYFRRVRLAAQAMPGERKIVFVRYAAYHVPHFSLITNDADLPSSRIWWVYDRGPAENARLRAMAPDRVAYVVDEEIGWIGLAEKARPWVPRDSLE